MRFKLLKGRLITEHDRSDSARVVVVSESFARMVWPDQEPLGQRVRRARGRPDEWMAVIGVVADAKEDRRRFRYDSPSWYIPYAQLDTSQPIHFVVRTGGEPLNTANALLLESVRSVDSKMPVFEIIRLSDHVQSYLGPERFPAVLLGVSRYWAFSWLHWASMG
jgi:hypothetical protein